MSAITTHVLDTAKGRPASGIKIMLEFLKDDSWQEIGSGSTNNDGRCADLLSKDHKVEIGVYRLTFSTQPYFATQSVLGFYPYVGVTFHVNDPAQHYHVPLLLSPFGYSTYRGS